MATLSFKTTADINTPESIVDQVIGQERAVEIIKKAGEQRRHVFLIGEPGTGKSMLGLALAELLPKSKLVDIVSFANPNDENMPLIRTVPAGQGRDLVMKARMQGMA
ncbi:MAG TPA: ATP-binding protein, partial [Candidatus Nanoarchaeia archaeon]|nr:ATP-binding protein [Candidatus Nanoarchaeia archaeon]